ncbi:MAG: hypothetical protein ACI9CO_000107 [Candidatus Azotimanducaceae bacterium]|jgi:hypothetical protein
MRGIDLGRSEIITNKAPVAGKFSAPFQTYRRARCDNSSERGEYLCHMP